MNIADVEKLHPRPWAMVSEKEGLFLRDAHGKLVDIRKVGEFVAKAVNGK